MQIITFIAVIVAVLFGTSQAQYYNQFAFPQFNQAQLNRALYIDPRYFGTPQLQQPQFQPLDLAGLERFERQLLAGRR